MTTAHRATWKAARGGLQEEGSFSLHVPSAAISSKDAPTERNLKVRHVPEQLSRGQLRARMRDEQSHPDLPTIEERPSKRIRTRSRFASLDETEQPPSDSHHTASDHQQDNPQGNPEHTEFASLDAHQRSGDSDSDGPYDSEDSDGSEQSGDNAGDGTATVDKIDANERADASDSNEDSESDEEDDEAELFAEVERIRKEREIERASRQAEQQERIQREEEERIINDNPLLGNMSSALRDEFSDTASMATGSVAFSVRRRWDDDVVFRNQARKEQARSARFINDTVHNDFHKRFMKKYIR